MRVIHIRLRQVRAGRKGHRAIAHTLSGQGMNASMKDTHNLGECIYFCSISFAPL